MNERTKTQVAGCTTALVLLTVACWGMVSPTTAPATSTADSPTQPLPVLLPVDLPSLTTRPPASGFEYALEQSSWGVNDWKIIRLIAQCESGPTIDRLAVGRAGEVGALQIHPRAHPELAAKYDLFDYAQNLQAGFEVHAKSGWSAWACWEGGY